MKKQINAAIITIGDEILNGQITDTNSAYIAETFSDAGIKTIVKFSVGDDREAIFNVLSQVRQNTDIVVITGGLGPTKDDITKTALADFFNSELSIQQEALKQVTAFFLKRGKELTELNRNQALLPVRSVYIPNNYGTAPGMWFEEEGQIFISLPGVPFEMKAMLKEEILPRLLQKYDTSVITHKIVRTVGIGESFLAEKIESWENNLPSNTKLAYLPEPGQVKLRLTITGNSLEENQAMAVREVEKLKELIGRYIYSTDNKPLEEAIGQLLSKKSYTIGLAESCTGGALAAALTAVPGSSSYFSGSIVAYDNSVKKAVLGVSEDTLNKFGAVSEETVKEMAEGVKKLLQTDFALSTSGIAGPGGGTPEKPVGTIWIACADNERTVAKKLILGNERGSNIRSTVIAALNMLRERINEKG